jgi:hypothetical protein
MRTVSSEVHRLLIEATHAQLLEPYTRSSPKLWTAVSHI